MKVQRKLAPGTIVEAEGDTVAELFEKLAALEEVFSRQQCGLFRKTSITFTVRRDKDNHVYHMAVCNSCGGEFRFGVRKNPVGMLFPQLKDADGNKKPNAGWSKWQPNGSGVADNF
jgi:hypothetical protein